MSLLSKESALTFEHLMICINSSIAGTENVLPEFLIALNNNSAFASNSVTSKVRTFFPASSTIFIFTSFLT